MSEPLLQPIEARLDGELRLVEADTPLRRVHLRARGAEDAPLAVPQLAALCRAAMRFGTLISRSVRFADDDHDITAWAEARPDGEGVHLIIRSWRERSVARPAGALARHRQSGDDSRGADNVHFQIQLDTRLALVGYDRLPDAIAQDEPIGKSLTALFRIEDGPGLRGPNLLEAIAERQPFFDQPVTARQDNQPMRLSGRPLFAATDVFAGYMCDLSVGDDPFSFTVSPPHGPEKLLSSSAFGSEFASALRQPLGRILANAETISGKLRGSLREGYANYAGDIVEAAQHLRALIDDLSDLEAIDRPNFAPHPDAIDLADIGRRAAGLLAVKASDHQMRILAPEADICVPATGEFRRVLQIMVNLVTNAIRYSPDGSTIRILASEKDDRAQIRVIDEGGGIAEADRERIFQKFERLGRNGDGGSGLGLYISRRIATALDGSLCVEASDGSGTTFLLDLPARTD